MSGENTRERFCHVSEAITLCYETFGSPSDPTALLIMGLGTQMIGWPDDFCRRLAGRGLHVVRFDNRDAGRSTQFDSRPPTPLELLTRSGRAARYRLGDMADDAVGLLAALELGPAHVIGASMGGAIAQLLAARHPEQVRSLASIMSNTGSLRDGQPAPRLYRLFLRKPARGRQAVVDQIAETFRTIGSTGIPQDRDETRAMAEKTYARGWDPAARGRQLAAILASGDRRPELARIRAPTVVIHGSADPLVRPSGGRAVARAIPGARLTLIEGMGHDLPRAAWPEILAAIESNMARADGARSPG